MLILSRKLNQEIVFPTIGVKIEVTRIRGSTVCLGIEAPKDIPILRGELNSIDYHGNEVETYPLVPLGHELRNRLNSLSLCLHVMKEYQDANMPIKANMLSRALYELHTVEEILACADSPNPFVKQLDKKQESPFVMLVDDSVNESELLGSYLRHCGIQVAISNDGKAALNLLECIQRRPDVILLDMVMPGLDGQSMLRELRSNPGFNNIKVFAVTGLPSSSVDPSQGVTVDRWFQKPVQPPQLVESIHCELAVTA